MSDTLPPRWSPSAARGIRRRLVVEGHFVLTEPAHFGSGEEGDQVDMDLLTSQPLDPEASVAPVLPGTTLAGALRSALHTRLRGSRAEQKRRGLRENDPVELLFGGYRGDDIGLQSALLIEDAYGVLPPPAETEILPTGPELREGVALQAQTRTAASGKLYDRLCWPAGTSFPLRFELVLTDHDKQKHDAILRTFCTVLRTLEEGEIKLGMRKRRGQGHGIVKVWRLRDYNLTQIDDLLAWLDDGGTSLLDASEEALETRGIVSEDTAEVLLDVAPLNEDQRTYFTLHATLALPGSLLIRSGLAPELGSPDMTHLRTRHPKPNDPHHSCLEPVLSGTSVAGALRARAYRIACTLGGLSPARTLIYNLFGYGPQDHWPERPKDAPRICASRLETREHVITDAKMNLVQNRVMIDRFTGGSYPGALFNQRPAFGSDATFVVVDLRLVLPKPYEIGLLLLLLKDLWTGDLPLGGEQSVGRGRLSGNMTSCEAILEHRYREGDELHTATWRIAPQSSEDGRSSLQVEGDREALQAFVDAFLSYLATTTNGNT